MYIFENGFNRFSTSLSSTVVEEAAEVLEAHIITTLCDKTDHIIMIGDHQQLKPNPTVYDLARKYNLETSLFERMNNNGVPYYQLKLQHRMRPEISSLLVPHIYENLQDHPCVSLYDSIRGNKKKLTMFAVEPVYFDAILCHCIFQASARICTSSTTMRWTPLRWTRQAERMPSRPSLPYNWPNI